MKCIRVDLPSELQELKIEIFSDLHIGSKKCDYYAIQERIDKVKNDKNTYAVILGDLVNNSILGSVAQADLYESDISPMMQIQKAVEMFMPIKDKIIGCTSGNHERRSMKQTGTDLIWLFCRELGIEDKYDYASALLFVRFGEDKRCGRHSRKMLYTMFISHGDSIGGKMVGSKANGLEKRGSIIPNCDIVLVGHTHQPLGFRTSYFEIDYHNSAVHRKETMFVNASATLDYEQYAEITGMKPSSKVSPVIILSGAKKEMKTIL